MLRWLKNEIKHFFYATCHMVTGKQPHEVDAAFESLRKHSPRDAFNVYESVMAEIESYGPYSHCTVITSYENISILRSAGLIIDEEHTTRQWLRRPLTDSTAMLINAKAAQITGSQWHGNTYANLVFSEVSSEPKKA